MKNLILFLLFAGFLHGQTETTTESREFWQADLPGGNYMVAVDSITSVSNHSYVLDGAVVVTEVTIDTTGATVARFYQITPVTEYSELNITGLLSERIKEISDRQEDFTGVDPTTTVQKTYPVTTHSKTVEYQVSTLAQLSSLYKSVTKALERGDSGKFSIK